MGVPQMIAVYLFETSVGPVLFETGLHSCLPFLEKGLAKIGYKTEDIKHVFLTHIHLDHAGAAWYFAQQGATVYVHEKGYKHLIDPSKLIDSAKKIYRDRMDPLWGKFKPIPKSQLVIASHQEIFTLGDQEIKALNTPGHAYHHIAWKTSDGLICGDVAGIRIESGPPVPPCPPPDVRLDLWRTSIDTLLKEEQETLFLAHYGVFQDGIAHLKYLKEEIDIVEKFTYELFQSEPNPKKAVPQFDEWSKARMQDTCPSKSIADYYGMANPTYMNLQGMYRYYKKREANELV